MPDVTVDIQVYCSCGEGICRLATGGDNKITVEPCEDCMTAAREEGKDEGYEEGHQAGLEEAADPDP